MWTMVEEKEVKTKDKVEGKKSQKKKKKKEKRPLGKAEFLFDFISLAFVLGVGIYFGYRSLYYYSKLNMKTKAEAQTLNGLVIQGNSIVQNDSVGLHQDGDGYYFKGAVLNNYVKLYNQIYRIVRVNTDNSVKLISEDVVGSFVWGENTDYKNSNPWNWLNQTEMEHSGIYLNAIPNYKNYLKETEYTEDKLNGEKIESSSKKEKDYGTLLTIKDYIAANGKNSYLNNGKIYYLIGHSADSEILYIEEDGSIQSGNSSDGYGIRSVITLKENIGVVSGEGTKDNPYVINTNSDKSYVGSYVKLGNDIWRVYEDGDNLKLNLNGYIKDGENDYVRNYSPYNSIFDLGDKTNIAYYLNTDYLNSLSYNNILLDFNHNTGEISDDTGYNYSNIYSSVVTSKVGLLNIFDYISNSTLADYFYLNTTSQVGSMAYDRYANGLLEESDVRDSKHIVPTVCIAKNSIKNGTGTAEDPYVVE